MCACACWLAGHGDAGDRVGVYAGTANNAIERECAFALVEMFALNP